MNTMIFSFPREAHKCCHSISIVLPLIHDFFFLAAQPYCDKVPSTPVSLKTHKVRYRNSPLVYFRGPFGVSPEDDRKTNGESLDRPLKWAAASSESTPPDGAATKSLGAIIQFHRTCRFIADAL